MKGRSRFTESYCRSMRPHLKVILGTIKADFEITQDSIHIWRAVQWCGAMRAELPPWVVSHFKEKTLSGDGVSFDRRSVNVELKKMEHEIIYSAVEQFRRFEKMSLDEALDTVQQSTEKWFGKELSIERVRDIHANRRAAYNKAKKIIEKRAEFHDSKFE